MSAQQLTLDLRSFGLTTGILIVRSIIDLAFGRMGMQIGGDWLLRDRDKEWVKIRDLCEESQDYDTLDALQALNDNTFDILEGLHQARESLLGTSKNKRIPVLLRT